MLLLGFKGIRSFNFYRGISTSLCSLNVFGAGVAHPRVSPKDHRKDPKVILQRTARKKQRAKRPSSMNPIYMDIPLAMKYLRAAEVGNSAESTTVSCHLTIIPEKGVAPLQGQVTLPKPMKDTLALVFTENFEQIEQLKASNYNYRIGGRELIEEIGQGTSISEFTHCFATPDMVSALKPIQRSLGVAGLMPTVKKGSVADDVMELVKNSAGQMTFRLKDWNLAIPVGRCDFSDEEIIRNIRAVADVVNTCQPAGPKKHIVSRCSLSSTRGPSVVIEFKDL